MLGAGFADGNEAQLMIYLQEAHLMAAVKEGNVAEVRRLVEQEEVDVNSRSYVSCTLMDIVYLMNMWWGLTGRSYVHLYQPNKRLNQKRRNGCHH